MAHRCNNWQLKRTIPVRWHWPGNEQPSTVELEWRLQFLFSLKRRDGEIKEYCNPCILISLYHIDTWHIIMWFCFDANCNEIRVVYNETLNSRLSWIRYSRHFSEVKTVRNKLVRNFFGRNKLVRNFVGQRKLVRDLLMPGVSRSETLNYRRVIIVRKWGKFARKCTLEEALRLYRDNKWLLVFSTFLNFPNFSKSEFSFV
jgi:hypothetical protein